MNTCTLLQRGEINKVIYVLLAFILSTHLDLAQTAPYGESFSSDPSCFLILKRKDKKKKEKKRKISENSENQSTGLRSSGGIQIPKKNKYWQKEALKNFCKYSLRGKKYTKRSKQQFPSIPFHCWVFILELLKTLMHPSHFLFLCKPISVFFPLLLS